MPYKLQKQPKKDLYWVVNKETGQKYSKAALPKDRAHAQMRALYARGGDDDVMDEQDVDDTMQVDDNQVVSSQPSFDTPIVDLLPYVSPEEGREATIEGGSDRHLLYIRRPTGQPLPAVLEMYKARSEELANQYANVRRMKGLPVGQVGGW